MRLPDQHPRRLEEARDDEFGDGSFVLLVPGARQAGDVRIEPLKRLLAALDGAELLDDAVALCGGGENRR
jgi:hypothetical protein